MHNKKSKKLQNKNALEFVLLNRGMDDPNYDNPSAPSKILMHVPKEDDEVNMEHKKMIEAIPEMCRGVYSDEAIDTKLKEMGIELKGDRSEVDIDLIKEKISEMHKENLYKAVDLQLNKKELNNYLKNEKKQVIEAEEITIDTNIPVNSKELDDNKIDQIFKNARIKADVVEYNEYGLKKTIDRELLQFVTNKEFREGVDIFIPAPNMEMIQQNRFDIDIKPEEMDEDYKEVYDALKSDDDEDCEKIQEEVEGLQIERVIKGGELEDDFVILANEGELPIDLETGKNPYENDNQIVLAETKPKNTHPSYKFITKEEKELLDKKFEKTIKEYDNQDEVKKQKKEKCPKVDKLMEDAVCEMLGNKSKKKLHGLTAKFEDEDEYEDYELDDDEGNDEIDNQEDEGEEYEEYEDYEDEEQEIQDKPNNNNFNKLTRDKQLAEDNEEDEDEEEDFNQKPGTIKIEYVSSNKAKKKRKPKKNYDNEEFTLKDLNEIITDKESVGVSLGLLNNAQNPLTNNNTEAIPEEEDDEGIPEYFAKKRLDITSVHGKIGVLPKTIKGESEKKEKINSNQTNLTKKGHKESTNIPVQLEIPKIPSNLPTFKKQSDDLLLESESKDDKKLRKKLLKEEKKEKRKQKKEMKQAFKVI